MNLKTDGVPFGIEWRRILKEVDEQLDSQEVFALCFLCRDHIPGAPLEKVTRGFDIFSELENRGFISSSNNNKRYLTELLYRGGRLDLLRKFGCNAESVTAEINKCGSCFSPFRLLLQYYCDELTHEQVRTMKFLAGSYVGSNKLQDATDAQSLFVILEKCQVLTPEDVLVLREMTSSIDRLDLLEKVVEYHAIVTGVPLPRHTGLQKLQQVEVLTPQYHHQPYCVSSGGNKFSPPSMASMTSYNDPPPPYTPSDGSVIGSSHSSPAHAKYCVSNLTDITIDRALTPPIDGCDKIKLAEELQREAEDMVKVRQIKRLQEIHISGSKYKMQAGKAESSQKREVQLLRKDLKKKKVPTATLR